MLGAFVSEFSLFRSSKTAYLSSTRRGLSKQHTLLLFPTLQVYFPPPSLKGLRTLQALNHVTIFPAEGKWRALPWVPINTYYLISQRGCWWLVAHSSISSFPLHPQRLSHQSSHPSLGNASHRDGATERAEDINQLFKNWNLLVINS